MLQKGNYWQLGWSQIFNLCMFIQQAGLSDLHAFLRKVRLRRYNSHTKKILIKHLKFNSITQFNWTRGFTGRVSIPSFLQLCSTLAYQVGVRRTLWNTIRDTPDNPKETGWLLTSPFTLVFLLMCFGAFQHNGPLPRQGAVLEAMLNLASRSPTSSSAEINLALWGFCKDSLMWIHWYQASWSKRKGVSNCKRELLC